jgi:hypothetical protein
LFAQTFQPLLLNHPRLVPSIDNNQLAQAPENDPKNNAPSIKKNQAIKVPNV